MPSQAGFIYPKPYLYTLGDTSLDLYTPDTQPYPMPSQAGFIYPMPYQAGFIQPMPYQAGFIYPKPYQAGFI